jgi:hypothetical protein
MPLKTDLLKKYPISKKKKPVENGCAERHFYNLLKQKLTVMTKKVLRAVPPVEEILTLWEF